MSYRVTTEEVKTLMEVGNNWPPNLTDATPFIATASAITNLLIDKVDAELLYPIELYLSAHFIMGKDLTRSKTGESEDYYWNKADFGFYLTSYGSQAVAFDTSKTLAGMCDKVNETLSFTTTYRE